MEGLVYTRELYSFMKRKQRYADWIKDRIKRFGWVEGVDYAINDFGKSRFRGRPRKEYVLTLENFEILALYEGIKCEGYSLKALQ